MLTAFPLALGIEEIFAPCVPNESVLEVVAQFSDQVVLDWMFLACR
jgi:hypothetical protein